MKNFTQIPNFLCKDKQLTGCSFRLLVYIMSKSTLKGWQFNRNDILTQLDMSRKEYTRARRILIELKYLIDDTPTSTKITYYINPSIREDKVEVKKVYKPKPKKAVKAKPVDEFDVIEEDDPLLLFDTAVQLGTQKGTSQLSLGTHKDPSQSSLGTQKEPNSSPLGTQRVSGSNTKSSTNTDNNNTEGKGTINPSTISVLVNNNTDINSPNRPVEKEVKKEPTIKIKQPTKQRWPDDGDYFGIDDDVDTDVDTAIYKPAYELSQGNGF